MHFRIRHHTRYTYSQPVALLPHLLYIRPRETSRQRLLDYSCSVAPEGRLGPVLDEHDNEMIWAHFGTEPTPSLEIEMVARVETLQPNPFDFVLRSHAVSFPFHYEPVFAFALGPYLAAPPYGVQRALLRWLELHLPGQPADTVPFITAINTVIFQSLRYQRREEEGIQSALETIDHGSGACRDYALLLIELCRTLGIAARFVSGYLYAPAGDNQRTEGAMHAWVEVYLPGAGWKALDPTHGIWCDDRFIPVAHAAQADTVNPIQGAFSSSGSVSANLTTTVDVERLD